VTGDAFNQSTNKPRQFRFGISARARPRSTCGGSGSSSYAAAGQLPIAGPSTFGIIEANAPLASNWVTGWVAGVPQVVQPSFNDISGTINNSQLPQSGNNTVLSNISGSTSNPQPNSISAVFGSALGAASGSIIYRTTSGWVTLPSGILGQVLATSGASNPPSWIVAAGSGTVQRLDPAASIFLSTNPCTVSCVVSVASAANNTLLANTSGGSAPPVATSPSTLLDIFSSAQGSVLQRGASIWGALTPGTSGQFLQTKGAGATAQWTSITSNLSAGTGISITGTTTATIAVSSTTGTGNVVFSASPTITGSGSITAATVTGSSVTATGSLNANSSVFMTGIPNGPPGAFVCFNTSNDSLARTGTASCIPSDERLKTSWAGSPGLLALLQLKPASFEWVDVEMRKVGRQLGMSAQQVERVMPEVVATGGDRTITAADGAQRFFHDIKTINHDQLIPAIINAVQTLTYFCILLLLMNVFLGFA
jgi:hypothetical protein